jgi:hypothetical protein
LIRSRVTTASRLHRLVAATAAATLALLWAGSSAEAATVHKGFWGPMTMDGVSAFPTYADLDVDIFQTSLRWENVAPTRPADPRNPADPAYRWAPEIDYALQQAAAFRMRVLVMIAGAPRWANGNKPGQYAPRDPKDFADFAHAASLRYPGVRLWMIWGEPGRLPNFKPLVPQRNLGRPLTPRQAAAPKRYARILDAAYGALKRVDRRDLVVGGNSYTSGEIKPVRWIENMRLRNGRPPRMDLYGHNPFSFRRPNLRNPPSPEENVDFSDLARFNGEIARYLGRPRNKRIRLFLSEFTIPTAVDREFNFHVTRKLQAEWITAAFRVARQVNAYGLGWIHIKDEPPRGPGIPIFSGGLFAFDGKPKPGYFAFKNA